MPYRYVPLLKSKAGEANALLNLSPAAKQRIFPVVHLATQVPLTFVQRVGAAWAGRALGVDGHFNFAQTGTTAGLGSAVSDLRVAGVRAVPSIEVGAAPPYLAAVQALKNGDGVVVKARIGDVPNVLAWATAQGWTPAEIDLVLTAGHLADIGAGVLDQAVILALQHQLPNVGWRSVTLSSSAAPRDYSALPLGTTNVPRLDWQLWQAVHPHSPAQLDFGDHGIGHPDMTEPPGFVMGNATVSVRYTIDDHWVVVKGRSVRGPHGQPMGLQYRNHAGSLVALPAFGGLPACWGDQRIQQIAAATRTPGSRQTWVEMGVNRHLELVADRLP